MGNCLDTQFKAEKSVIDDTGMSEGKVWRSSISKSFSLVELRNATRNFHPDAILGEGGFGKVYKGWIDEHTLTATKPGTGIGIAVKMLNKEGFQGHREWLAEVNNLGRLYHPNLVKLIGHCEENEQRLLVYQFMPRGSLKTHLFSRHSHYQPLSWGLRMKIAYGAAKGLAFLHSAETKIIHRGFNTSKILLDMHYNARLSDFVLAKNGPSGDQTHVTTMLRGSLGYGDPAYLISGHLTTMADVYSFGVVFLEILTGRPAIDRNRPLKEEHLLEWAKPFIKASKIEQILDARLGDQYPLEDAQKAGNLALQCVLEAEARPNMDEIVKALEELQDSEVI